MPDGTKICSLCAHRRVCFAKDAFYKAFSESYTLFLIVDDMPVLTIIEKAVAKHCKEFRWDNDG